MRLFPRSCAVWWKRTARSASTSSVPSPGETPGRTATTTLWSSCLTTRRPNSVAVAPPMWRSGVPGLRPTCWFGPPASSIAVCTSLRPCRLLSSVREDYSMPHDPALVAEVRAWLSKGGKDLAAAEYELQADPPFTDDIVFHAQQAAEKSDRKSTRLNSS